MKVLMFFGLFMACASAYAFRSISNATVTSVTFDYDYPNVVIINVSGNIFGVKPSCHTSLHGDYFIDTNTERGKQMYSAILLLKASGKKASFAGTGSCDGIKYSEIEKLQYLHF